MAPLVLKLNSVSNLFDDLTMNPDELFDTWRVCTKAKKALEHGSRLENISWRRWFLHVQRQSQQKPKVSASVLERQYKRNLLIQQRKQCEQTLQATTKPATFVDNQYQPPPILTSTSTTSTCSSNDSPTLGDDTLMTCLSYPMPMNMSFDDSLVASDPYIHPAMYVASNEPFVPSSSSTTYLIESTNTSASSSALLSSTSSSSLSSSSLSLASYLTTTQHHQSIRTKKKAKKVRVRCPLPVINGKDSSVCDDCGTHSTPLWRRYQNRNLCNACGLYWKLHNSPRPTHLIPSKEDPNNPVPCCTNCGTMTTPLWRRNEIDGSPLCNACGLYAKLHQETRPLSMKTNTIKKRQRLS